MNTQVLIKKESYFAFNISEDLILYLCFVPFGLWFIFQVYSLKTYEKLFGPSDKIEENFWTFQVIQELKSQSPRKLRPRQYKKIMKKWEKGGLRVQITHLY